MFRSCHATGTNACAFVGKAEVVPVERLDPRVVAVIRSLTDRTSPYAEIWRRARPVLERRGLACPGYGAVRRIVREERYRLEHPPRFGGAGVHVELSTGHISIT
jgi:hypothetical protein